ncbi:MAG: phosphoribosylformylglycinamidine synthase subunit PurQ [Candidatus Tectomicrobia bacterium]|nr:phosphoribosylformylglycinamidine synthase subunit PurQ [Candidatus Tectomicrobia bacterium]
MRFGVVTFPGSNCDHDCYHVLKHVLGRKTRFLWHKETGLGDLDCVVLPGGFSYGDYLRTGALARFSPVMRAVEDFAKGGGLVLGICNGFQILLEAGLLPGAMLRNRSLRFICRDVCVRVESGETPYTRGLGGRVLKLPIAHMEGNYYADPATLRRLERERRVVFRYADPDGSVTEAANPNGSLSNIAGICNEGRNVLGMMPHPERASEAALGGEDGRRLFDSLLAGLAS